MQIYHYIFTKNNNELTNEDFKSWDHDSASLLLKTQNIDILDTKETDDVICFTVSKKDGDEVPFISALDDNIYIVYRN